MVEKKQPVDVSADTSTQATPKKTRTKKAATRAPSAKQQKKQATAKSTKKTTKQSVPAKSKRGGNRKKTVKKDSVLDRAVERAREAVNEVAPVEYVGEHLGSAAEAERLLSHYFACLHPGYVGWAWIVTLARVPRSKTPTVCEIELVPHDGALLAPPWLPWEERMNPADGSNDDDEDYDVAEDGRLTPDRRKGEHGEERRFEAERERGESPWEIDPLRVNDLTLEVLDPRLFWPTEDK